MLSIMLSRKAYSLNGFDTFFSQFSTEFFVFLPVFVVVIRLMVMSYWLRMYEKYPFLPIET